MRGSINHVAALYSIRMGEANLNWGIYDHATKIK